MTRPALTRLVRFKSPLTLDEVVRVAEERLPEFQALEGLQQRYYMQDAETGEYAGLYLWESPEHLKACRDSELRASIAAAYRTEGQPRTEVYRVIRTLRD